MASQKGGNFEREMCRKISLWWSGGEEDDLFWRSAGSGGLVTRRKKNGTTQKSQHGDLVATDARGAAFTDTFTVEMKRGYGQCSMLDILDAKEESRPKQTMAKFIEQATREAQEGGREHWVLILRRDKRNAVAIVPHESYAHFTGAADIVDMARTYVTLRYAGTLYVCVLFEDFFCPTTRENIAGYHEYKKVHHDNCIRRINR